MDKILHDIETNDECIITEYEFDKIPEEQISKNKLEYCLLKDRTYLSEKCFKYKIYDRNSNYYCYVKNKNIYYILQTDVKNKIIYSIIDNNRIYECLHDCIYLVRKK